MKHDYEKYVNEALNNAGRLSECYSLFHNYSLGNQFLAMLQLDKPEPINTFKGWQKLGRNVKKGSKAIQLLMPVTIKKENEEGEDDSFTTFIARKNWFGLSQTEGAEYVVPTVAFDIDSALERLGIEKIEFSRINGNSQGYAKPSERKIAVNPLAKYPLKTTFHEIAHCLLHGEAETMHDTETLAPSVKEVEAELVAYICCASLGLVGMLEESRGYIQHWMDKTAEKPRLNKVFAAVTEILKTKVEG